MIRQKPCYAARCNLADLPAYAGAPLVGVLPERMGELDPASFAAAAQAGLGAAFGGTFDPVHLGHLLMAEQAREQGQLDQVWFVPAASPPHKQEQHITPFAQRVEMLGPQHLKLTLTQGIKRQIRLMLYELGYEVERLAH